MQRPRIHSAGWVVAQAILFYALTDSFAHAQIVAGGVGETIRSGAQSSYGSMPILLNYLAYIAGFTVCVVGLWKVKSHIDHPDRIPLSHGLWHLFGAGLLVSLPMAAGLVQRTMRLTGAGNVTRSATAVALDTSAATMSLDKMMIRLVADIRGPMQFVIWSLGVMLGFFFLVTAFLRMARGAAQDGPKGSIGSGTLMRVIIGSVLISTAATADLFTNTLFGGGVSQFRGLSIPGVNAATLTNADQAMSAILIFVQIIGFIAFMRGFLMLRALADGNSSISTAAAFTHIFGGAVAINIAPTLRALERTFCGTAGCNVINW